MSNRKLTKAQALRALVWAEGHLGLDGWDIELWWQSDMPEWAHDDANATDGGYFRMSVQYRFADIWINLKVCDGDPDFDRLSVLMHEMVHLAHNSCNFEAKFYRAGEFLTDRFADALAFAYRHKMKPWRPRNPNTSS